MLEPTAAKLPPEVKVNLDALTAIRDNSIHYVTASVALARQAQELAAASIRNFVLLAKKWFGRDFASVLNLVLPLSFVTSAQDAGVIVVSADETRLIDYLRTLAKEAGDSQGDYAVAVRLQLKLEKSSLTTASKVQLSRDVDAVKVQLSEQDIRERYPWDYTELSRRLAARYSDFRQNQKYHDIRTPLHTDEKYAKARYLDPGNLASQKKTFYNSNVLHVFDQHYAKH